MPKINLLSTGVREISSRKQKVVKYVRNLGKRPDFYQEPYMILLYCKLIKIKKKHYRKLSFVLN